MPIELIGVDYLWKYYSIYEDLWSDFGLQMVDWPDLEKSYYRSIKNFVRAYSINSFSDMIRSMPRIAKNYEVLGQNIRSMFKTKAFCVDLANQVWPSVATMKRKKG